MIFTGLTVLRARYATSFEFSIFDDSQQHRAHSLLSTHKDYSRVNVAVETFENIDDPSSKLTVSTGVYVWTSPQNQLEEFEWDYEAFLQKDMRNFVNADLAQG